jgi:TfoX/Sxy family transcriptional regulator of competence genes
MAETTKTGSMHKWEKPAPELIKTFQEAMQPLPGIQMRQMFGCPTAFINGQMFACLQAQQMVLRLSEAERTAFLQLDGARPFEPMAGRVMREYVVVPAPMLASPEELDDWILKALAYAHSLPPKEAKPKGKAKK